jgi:hypothetical protein
MVITLVCGGGDGHDVDVGEAVEPAGGLGVGGVDDLDDAAFGVGETGFHDGYDDLAFAEGGFDFCAGVDNEVLVGAGGDDGAVEDEGFVSCSGERPALARTSESRGPE